MAPWSKEELLHALFLLKSMLGAEFGKKSSACDLSMQEYALMRQLSTDGGAANLTAAREYLAVTKAAVSQMLASLEKRNLLVRKTDPANRRNIIVTLTPEGMERLRQKETQVEYRLSELLSELGESDALQFMALIHKMKAVLSAKKEET